MRFVPLLLALGLTQATVALAQGDDGVTRPTLRGIRGFNVVVEEMRPEAEREGLAKTTIQTDVELRLRLAGLPVVTLAEAALLPGSPFLYVRVVVVPVGTVPFHAYHINVSFTQEATMTRAPIRALVDTWGTGSIGWVPQRSLGSVRRNVGDAVDQFINAWLSVNPRSR